MRRLLEATGFLLLLLPIAAGAPDAVAGLATPTPQNEREAMVRVLTEWDLGCSGSARPGWKGMTEAWYDEITNGQSAPTGHGGEAWYADGFYHQDWTTLELGIYKTSYVVDSDYTDPDNVAWGLDYTNDKPDEVDVFMTATHGGNATGDDSWTGTMRIDEAGTGNCSTYQGHMEFGDLDMEFLHLSSCRSMDESDWHPDWDSTFHGLHQIDGFHGLMYIYSDQEWYDRYRDFGDDSFSMPIAQAWIDNHYRYTCAVKSQDPITLERRDQCPVARGAGSSEANVINRMLSERYDNVLSDPVSPSWHYAFYIGGCDPDGDEPIAEIVTPCDPFAEQMGGSPQTLRLKETDGALGFPEYRAQVDGALPAFDASVLAAADGPDWMRGVQPPTVATAMADTIPTEVVSDGANTQATGAGGDQVIKIQPGRGRIRYLNLARGFDFASSPRVAWDPAASRSLVLAAAAALSVPLAETDPARCCTVDTLRGTGFDAADADPDPDSVVEVERMVTVQRHINHLPVLESMVRASVSNTGKISRMLVRWPRFRLPPGLALRDRDSVLDELAGHLADAQSGVPVSLIAYLAYERAGDHYLPVAVVEHTDGVSGEIVTARLVDLPADSDHDGIPDGADNCGTSPNHGQADRDLDGVGDACDNCPDAPNPLQEDAEPDGTGDACEVRDGACVLRDGSCDESTEAQCADVDGTFHGEGAACARVQAVDLTVMEERLEWSTPPMATAFDVVKGDLALLRASGGDFALATAGCVVDDDPAASLEFEETPGRGETLFVLVRSVVDGAGGTYDSAGPAQVEGRDLEIRASGLDCP